jgi:hypothetical protein
MSMVKHIRWSAMQRTSYTDTFIYTKNEKMETLLTIHINRLPTALSTSYPIPAACPYPYYPYSEAAASSANQVSLLHTPVPVPGPVHTVADEVNVQHTDCYTDYTHYSVVDSTLVPADIVVDRKIVGMVGTWAVVVVMEGLETFLLIHLPKRLDSNFS